MLPALSVSIFVASQSTQTTLWPPSAKQVPVTSPTYPVPMMEIFMAHLGLAGLSPISRTSGWFVPKALEIDEAAAAGALLRANSGCRDNNDSRRMAASAPQADWEPSRAISS